MDRRMFIGGLASCGLAAGCRWMTPPVARPLLAPGENLRLGVLSDIHLCEAGDEETFLAALRYFRECHVDGVIIAGDIADTGRIDQLARCAKAWFSIFPEDKLPDGSPVERLFVYGNHCVTAWTWGDAYKDHPERAAAEAIGYGDNRARVWRELFHEPYEPIWMKTVKGVPIIGAHWDERPAGNRIEDFLREHAAALDPQQPLIYIQHDHPKDTCLGSWAWGHDDGRAARALARFPKAIAFSGHSHYSLTDERSVWQGAFTSINTASLSYVSTDYSLRENMPGNGDGYQGETRARRMAKLETGDGRQGMVVTLCEDHLEIERRDFVRHTSLGPDWIVPLPAAPEAFGFAARAKLRVAPEFDPTAKLTVVRAAARNEQGFTPIALTFPAAKTRHGCRVFEYEITAVLCEDDVELVQLQRRMMSPDFYRPESDAVQEVTYTFAAEDLPLPGRYRLEVRPLECFGKKGRPLECFDKMGAKVAKLGKG